MEEKLIEEIKKHKNLYIKGSVDYKNRKKRAEAWNLVSQALNMTESACQSRWKSLRDRYVKEFNKKHLASGSASEVPESSWILYPNMQFLQEQVTPRKTTSSVPHRESSETSTDGFEIINITTNLDDSFLDFSECTTSSPLPVIESTSQSSNEAPSTSQRNRKRNNNANDFGDFLKQMSSIAEKRFCSKLDDAPKVTDKHQGFILMVQDLFSKLNEEAVDDSKIFFINYLHSRIKEYNDIRDF